MTISFGDLRLWRSSGVTTASTALQADIKVLERSADQVEAETIPSSWGGLGRLSAVLRQTTLVKQMRAHVTGLSTFEIAVFSAATTVKTIEQQVADLDTDAGADQFSIGPDGMVTDISPIRTFESVAAADHHVAQRTTARDALVARIVSVLDLAYQVDSDLIAARPQGSFSADGPDYVVDPEVAREWANMSDDERRAVLEHIARERAEEAGVDDFDISIEDLEDRDGDGDNDDPDTDTRGGWTEAERTLRIDEGNLDDPTILGTVAHEVRHAQQHKEVDDLPFWWWEDYDPPPGLTEAEVEDWQDNFDDYKTSVDDGFDAYHDQPVESDARETGGDFLDALDKEELERIREEAR